MKKKKVLSVLLIGALICTLFIPQVNAFAMDALSNFRVGQAKTITFTLDDIAQMAGYIQDEAMAYDEAMDEEDWAYDADLELMESDYEEPEIRRLDSIEDFDAFEVSLPKALKDEEVTLHASEMQKKTFAAQDGTEMTVALSPTLAATYDDAMFIATQGISDTMSSEQKAEIKEKLIALPIWTENIRSQLAEIDPSTKDIYLPVLSGISREAVIGKTTGYLYGMNELQGMMGALPAEFSDEFAEADTTELENVNALIWTEDGVLYLLMGDMPEAELIDIARSVGS